MNGFVFLLSYSFAIAAYHAARADDDGSDSTAQGSLYHYGRQSEVLTTGDRISGMRSEGETDFVLGGLIPVHSEDPSHAGGKCGEVRDDEEVEAMLFAIDSINANASLLPGMTLGYDIRDTCYSENVGLDEAADLIIAGSADLNLESCDIGRSANSTSRETTLGIVGALSSRVSKPVASLTRLFKLPQISYASTSPSLSNRDLYTYFYRTIPPDDLQAKAIVDLLSHFRWTHFSTVYINDPYGKDGIEQLHKLAAERDMCVDLDIPIEIGFTEDDYRNLALRLYNSSSSVAILFAHEQNAQDLFAQVAELGPHHRGNHPMTWIGSEAWVNAINNHENLKAVATGYFGVLPDVKYSEEFYESYLPHLTLNSNKRNVWFPEFVEAIANCEIDPDNTSVQQCNRSQSVFQLKEKSIIFGAQIIDAVNTFAHALDNFLKENCETPVQWSRTNHSCVGQMRELNGSALLEYIQKVSFTSPTGNVISFDENGNVVSGYEIVNFQNLGSEEYDLKHIGVWKPSTTDRESELKLSDTCLQYGVYENNSVILDPPLSQCGVCEPGQYLLSLPSLCHPCLGRNYSNSSYATKCDNCSTLGDYWGDSPTTGSSHCVEIEEEYLRISHPWSIIIALLSILGLLLVTATAVVVFINWRSPVIKSSGREQMVLLLSGIALSFVLPLLYVSPPSLGVCVLQRIGIWICVSFTFGAVLVKVVRVYRIFVSATHIRFTEPHYQVAFTLLIVAGQLVIVAASIGYRLPGVSRVFRRNSDDTNDSPVNVLSCVSDHTAFLVLSIGYISIIVVATTVIGIKSFKYPKNFNEARFISFCSFALLLIWLTFIPSYFIATFRHEFQSAVVAMAILMTAFAELACLFGHKLFVIFFRSEENKKPMPTSQSGYDNTKDTRMDLSSSGTLSHS